MTELTKQEIMKITNRYIGVSGGYLGDFSYRTHAEFYSEYCDVDVDPYVLDGTTRERFIKILETSVPQDQAKIIRGVVERFPVGTGSASRTEALKQELLDISQRLNGVAVVKAPSLAITSAVVERAISDAEALLKANGATSSVDRVHTALHGYLIAVCEKVAIPYEKDASITTLFKLIKQGHPAFAGQVSRQAEIETILRSSSAILDALNPVRNKASVAHPNQKLLPREEAFLVINIARSLLHYFDSKLS
jgi:hypothetical protein